MVWSVEVGPISIGSSGLAVKPKMDFGVRVGNFKANAGIGDVREALSIEFGAEVEQCFSATGESLDEFLRNLRATDGLADSLLNPVVERSNAIVAEVVRLVGVSVRTGHIEGVLGVKSGVGMRAAVAGGWEDPEGYRMVGAGGEVAAGLSLGLSIFAGRRGTDEVKVLLDASNFGVEFEVRVRDETQAGEGEAAGGGHSSAAEGTGVAAGIPPE